MENFDEKPDSPVRIAMNYGAVIAVLMLGVSFVGWQKISWIVFLFGIYKGMKRYRRELGGAIDYFRALLAGFQTAFFTSSILAFVAYVTATLDPSVIDTAIASMEQQLNETNTLLRQFVDASVIQQARKMMSPVMFAALCLFRYCAIGGLASILFAFFVRRLLIFVKY